MTKLQTFLVLTLLIVVCLESATAQDQASKLKEVRNDVISLVYNPEDFGEVAIGKESKQTAQDVGEDVPIGVAPEHFCVNLSDKRPLPALERGARYFYPTKSFICFIPLQDPSVNDFAHAYPDLNRAAINLKKILALGVTKFRSHKDLPDIPFNNASPSILSRFQFLNFRSGRGLLFLTQYSQEMEPNPVNNEELTLNFQGLTKDGKYYVAARLAITQPSLPKGIDDTADIKRDKNYQYLRSAEKRLERFPEETFQPSLGNLKALLSSMAVNK